jgi:hypothetical protein
METACPLNIPKNVAVLVFLQAKVRILRRLFDPFFGRSSADIRVAGNATNSMRRGVWGGGGASNLLGFPILS